MKKITKIFGIITILVMTMSLLIPTFAIATETNMNDTDLVINIYEGRKSSDFSDMENNGMLYLFDMYRIVQRPYTGNGAYVYANTAGKSLFALIVDPDNEEDRSISIAPDVTSADNIVVYPDKDFFISIQDFGTSENVPRSITLNFTTPPQDDFETVTIYDGIDVTTMTPMENACMSYLLNSNTIKMKQEDGLTIFYRASDGKNLIYANSNTPIMHIYNDVTKADNISVIVDTTDPLVAAAFTRYAITKIPKGIKLEFDVQNNILKGDLDGNNVVDANDASVALELYKSQSATDEDIAIGDMDENNLIDANDASLILEYYKTHQ